jgi:hypothetical protein
LTELTQGRGGARHKPLSFTQSLARLLSRMLLRLPPERGFKLRQLFLISACLQKIAKMFLSPL